MSINKSFFEKALIKSGLSRLKNKFKKSYSQTGEDLIIDYIFNVLGINKPTYLDIGAFDYSKMNNTYLFYQRGLRGVCIEPDPILFEKFKKRRPADTCLNVGITADKNSLLDFYIMSSKTLNTFSEEEAKKNESMGYRIEKITKIETRSINSILDQYFTIAPNLISLDVEGLDLEILERLDFNRHRPDVLCVETIDFADGKEVKNTGIIRLLESEDYLVFADTHINTIFVNSKKWSEAITRYVDSIRTK